MDFKVRNIRSRLQGGSLRSRPFYFGENLEEIETGLAESFFGAEVEWHEDLDGDAAAAVVEFLDADNFAEGFLIDGAGSVGIGKGDEEAEAFFVAWIFGDEVDAVESGVFGGKDFVEIGRGRLGRAHTDDTWEFQTAFAAAFFDSQARHALLWAQGRAGSQAVSQRKVPECKRVSVCQLEIAAPGDGNKKKLEPLGAVGHQVG